MREKTRVKGFFLFFPITILSCLIYFTTANSAQDSPPSAKPQNMTPAQNNGADYQKLKDQMQLLRERQDLLIQASEKDLERVYWAFLTISAIFSVLALIFGFRQMVLEKRRQKIEEGYFKEMQSVMNSFRDNISTINTLISTLKQVFDFQGDIKNSLSKVDDRLNDLQTFKEKEELLYRSEIDSMNARSAQLFKECKLHNGDRDSFKLEENKVKLQSFCGHYDTLARTGDIGEYASPVSIFMRALGHFNSNEYEPTADLMHKARDFAKAQLVSPLSQYGTWDAEEVKKNLVTMLNETSYHLGIVCYNTGKYEQAKNEFKISFERNPLDFRSRIYIPELMFFEMSMDPAKCEAEYEEVETELNNVPAPKRKTMVPPWDIHYASLMMRKGNFYLPKLIELGFRAVWKKFEDKEKAIECYWSARNRHPQSTFVKLSLAQSMHGIGRSSLWRDENPEDLCREVFTKFKNEAILKTEPILLCLIYYCAAISCWIGNIQKENPVFYLNQARQHLQRVPRGIKVFSPINKINLSKEDILKEMERLEDLF